MTDIDIKRLRMSANERGKHWDGCIYHHGWCAVLALIEDLKSVKADFDYVSSEYSKSNRLISDYKAKSLVERNRREKAEAQRDRLRAGLEKIIEQTAGSIVHGVPVCVGELESYNRRLRELLEGEK